MATLQEALQRIPLEADAGPVRQRPDKSGRLQRPSRKPGPRISRLHATARAGVLTRRRAPRGTRDFPCGRPESRHYRQKTSRTLAAGRTEKPWAPAGGRRFPTRSVTAADPKTYQLECNPGARNGVMDDVRG